MTDEQRQPLHPVLARELKEALNRTPEQWRDPALMQQLARVVEKHKDRHQMLVQLYATAHDMYDKKSMETAAFYMAVVALVVGDERAAQDAAAGALDAAKAAEALGKHVNREAAGVKAAMAPRAGSGVGLRGKGAKKTR